MHIARHKLIARFYSRVALAVCVATLLAAASAGGQVATDGAASILFLTDVEVSPGRVTSVQLSNTSNNLRFLTCLFIDGATGQQVNFDLVLPRQSSLVWPVSKGLRKALPACGATSTCVGDESLALLGVAPTRLIPPLPQGFRGGLLCVEVDASHTTLAGNAFVGTATPSTLANGQFEKINALGLKGFDTNNADDTLCLGGMVTNTCPTGAEYTACPLSWDLSHPSPGTSMTSPGVSTDTNVFALVCSQDFRGDVAGQAHLTLRVTNSFGQTFSTTTLVHGYSAFALSSLGINITSVGSEIASTRIMSSDSGFVVTAEKVVTYALGTFRTALKATYESPPDDSADTVVLPPRG